jgi:ketosteroid isomerase-like protein
MHGFVYVDQTASYHEFGTERKVEGPDQIFDLFKGWKPAFPDAAGTVTNSVASGNTAVLEVAWKGPHGKHQGTPAAVFYAFGGAKIKASRHYFDAMTLLEQIDAQPK